MDKRMLHHYNRELQHLREVGAEFAREFPKIAGRLGLEGFECADPYVERLLEGFAFMSARVQLKLESEFPRFTQHLLDTLYPHYLAPTPSMLIAQLDPDHGEGTLAEGYTVPRDSVLRGQIGAGDQTACEYRTAHPVTLWPIRIEQVSYHARDLAGLGLAGSGVKAALRLRLRVTGGLTFKEIGLDELTLHLSGTDDVPTRLYEQLLARGAGLVARPARTPAPWQHRIGREQIAPVGFEEDEALLPFDPRSFHGYRLLLEYFALPQRFMFVKLGGLQPAVKRCEDDLLEVVVLLSQADPHLEGAVEPHHLKLFCTPAINLFPKRADRIHISDRSTEFHLVADRTKPLDFEVYQVTRVVGFGADMAVERPFLPFYAANDLTSRKGEQAYYAVNRQTRLQSSRELQRGARSSYLGSEVFLSLVDAAAAPYASDLRQLSVETLCTNRDLPLSMPLGVGPADFTMESGAPVEAVHCITGPTRPRESWAQGETAWRLISHLSLNYLSLAGGDDGRGAEALREILGLYADLANPGLREQVEALRDVRSRPVVRRVGQAGPIAFARGLQVSVDLDESAFHGSSAYLFAAVLERFFCRYVSINAFTETVLQTAERGEVARWPARIGNRQLL